MYLSPQDDALLRNLAFRGSRSRGDLIGEFVSRGIATSVTNHGKDAVERGVEAMRDVVVAGEGATPEQERETELSFDRAVVRAVLLACAPKVLLSADSATDEAFVTGRAIVGGRTGKMDAGDLISALIDKIEGLESDLDNAVETAYDRGAEEWAKANYPARYLRLKRRQRG